MQPILPRIFTTLYKSGILTPKQVSILRYFLKFKRLPDLKSPKDINEKILWLTFNADTTKWTELADKYLVRNYVRERGLAHLLVKLYGVYKSADEIEWDALPDKFVVKTNNGYGTVLLVKNKAGLDIPGITKKLNRWLDIPFGAVTAEPHYMRIRPRIIVEELLENDNDSSTSLIDYKFWCFDGIPRYCFTGNNRNIEHHTVDFNLYEIAPWKERKDYMSEKFKNEIHVSEPPQLKEMREYAAILSEGFPAVRVDFYNINGKVYFGEMTFTSNAGRMSYFTNDFLLRMGNLIKLKNNL